MGVVELRGPLAGIVVAIIGLYLVFAPIGQLARKPSAMKREFRPKIRPRDVPTWVKVFFRGLGILLLILAAVLIGGRRGLRHGTGVEVEASSVGNWSP